MSKIDAHSIPAFDPQGRSAPVSLSELYHENTKLHPLIGQGIPSENYTAAETRVMTYAYKQYLMASRLKLHPISDLNQNEKTFDEVITSRRTYRDFADQDLDFHDFSKILFQSYGITGKLPGVEGSIQYLRSSPSAGALYPAEIYIGVRRVADVEPGIYHYNVPNHEIELLNQGDPSEKLYEICCQQEYVHSASMIVLISAVLPRTKLKYGERGYRYALLDIGHLGQNIYLSCAALDLAIMTTCGFFDDQANKLLQIDGVDETTLYVAFIGKRKADF